MCEGLFVHNSLPVDYSGPVACRLFSGLDLCLWPLFNPGVQSGTHSVLLEV
jgi:hypothetical protein